MTEAPPQDRNSAPLKSKGSEPLHRAVIILECVGAAKHGLTIKDISDRANLPQPTAHRIVKNLIELGMLAESDSRFLVTIGPRLHRILFLMQDNDKIANVIQSELMTLANLVGECVFVTRLRDIEVESIAHAFPTGDQTTLIHPGNRFPIHATATGKVILSHQGPELIAQISNGELERFTEKTITSPVALISELSSIKKQGYAISDGELDRGVFSIAFPLQIPRVGVVCSVGMVGLQERINRQGSVDSLVLALQEAADILSTQMASIRNSETGYV